MEKRIFRLILLAIFTAFIIVTVHKIPKMNTDASHALLTETSEAEVLEYDNMSEKELLVLAFDGDGEACYQLGVRYDYGTDGIAQNFSSAFGWYRAADAYGQINAAAALGFLYLNGCGVDKSIEQATSFFERSIELGDAEGYVGLGRVALENISTDETATERAFSEFSQAADKGNIDGVYYLGYVYEKGIGTEADYDEARAYYEKVIETDTYDTEYSYAVHDAYTRLGLLAIQDYFSDLGSDDGRELIEVAAEDGYAMAQYYMGIIYEQGLGVSTNYDTALSWLEQSAQHDYAPALNEIGYMYFNGLGVAYDYEQALYYQKLSAALGFEKAQVNLGYLYENGYGVEQNLSVALEYYEQAGQNGYPGAGEAKARILDLMAQQEETAETTEETTP